MYKTKYSFIILVKNETNLSKTIDSINNQKYDKFLLELIVLDMTNKGISKTYLEKYNNINYQKIKKGNEADAYNLGLKLSTGDYVTFINSNIYYDNFKMLKKISKLNENVISLYGYYYDSETLKMKHYKMQPKYEKLYDVSVNPYSISILFESYFIKKNLLKKIKFSSDIYEDYKLKFLIDLLSLNSCFYFINKKNIISLEPFEDNTSKSAIQYNKWWYFDSFKAFWLNLLKKYNGNIPGFIQEIVVYQIYTRYNTNIYDRNKGVLSEAEFNEFENLITEILLLIDDNYLIHPNDYSLYSENELKYQFKIPRWLKYYLLENKIKKLEATKKIYIKNVYEKDIIFLEYENKKEAISSIPIGEANSETVNVYAINLKDSKLYFDCTISLRDYLYANEIKIVALYNDKEIPIKVTETYPLLKAFGRTLSRKYPFSFSIDALPNKKNKLEIFAYIGKQKIKLNFRYLKIQARLNNSKRSFWHYKDFIMLNKKESIKILKANLFYVFLSELLFDLSKLKNGKKKIRVCKLLFLRMLYYVTKPYYKNKHIWLTWDKLYKAGDNGEYLYKYGLKHGKNIYYVIKKDSLDYERLKKENPKHIIEFNSLKEKLFSLHAEVILKTHANAMSYCSFNRYSKSFVSGLFNVDIIEVQHGLTIQKIAQFQNRLFDNIKHYCCTSKYEVENILKPFYNFSKSQITLTGLARYDGLKSNDKKIILITPTWRKNVVNSNVAHIKKQHNDNFINSDYFHIYDSLINNKKLIEVAKKTGYKIIYLLHPAMSAQLEDFDKNNYVEIIPAAGDVNYEKILTESSLMVTDYSGVQFDFAYQRKVLIYYHPDKLPPHYDAGGLDYKNMGFGPIFKQEEDLVEELCNYMENGCKIKQEYKKRADDFFAFSDFNNCKRIIDAVDKYLSNK